MRAPVRGSAPGFSLVELMVTIAVLGVVMTAVFTTLFRSNDASRYVANITETRQSARAAVQLFERDVRMAGSGWGRMPLNVSNNGTPQVWYALEPGPGPGAGSDSMRLIGAWEATTTLAADMATPSSVLDVVNASGFAVDDLVVVTDGNTAHVFQLTGVNTGTGVLDHATSSPFNATAGFANWPGGGYVAGRTEVYKIAVLTYRVDSTMFRRPSLLRTELGRAPAVVLYDVNRFNVWYRVLGSPDSLTRAPGSIFNVDKVQPRIHTRVAVRGRPTLTDSVWSEVKPRTL